MNENTSTEEYISSKLYINHVSAGFAIGIILGATATSVLFLVGLGFLI